MSYTDPIPIAMLTNVLTDETTSDAVPLNNAEESYHSVVFNAGSTSGVVVVETAPTRDYSGTWVEQLTVDASATLNDELRLIGIGGFVRHRISTVIAGGGSPGVTSTCRRKMAGC